MDMQQLMRTALHQFVVDVIKIRILLRDPEFAFLIRFEDGFGALRFARIGSGRLTASADAAADLRTARRALVNAEEKRDLSDMYAAYRSVLTAADSVELTFDDPADRDLYDNCKSVISGASRELEKSDYNDNVNRFLIDTYYSFPSSVFARLFMVDAPELFA